MSSVVQRVTPAASDDALAHFQARLGFETDCADVYYATNHEAKDFVLLDVRTPTLYAAGHVPGALNLPTRMIGEQRLAEYPPDTLFVVYCAGPHCNGANKAAVKLAQLGRPVKEMIGGLTGWIDEGFGLER
jgi:rhodanese-related sulfurtransferase